MAGAQAGNAIAQPEEQDPQLPQVRRVQHQARAILDDAGSQDTAAVLTEMPPPARLIYRRVLRPRYSAQHRWQTPSPAPAKT